MFSYKFGFDAQMTDAAYPAYIKETLPASKLGYATNNRYPQFPPKMQDGRSLMSSWTPESVVDHQYWKAHETQFRADAPLNPNWMYRRHLQKNALDIIAQNFRETANDTGFSAASVVPVGVAAAAAAQGPKNAPYLFQSLNDPATEKPGYESSDLKSLYLTREQLQARKSAPTVW
jgi:hypothetical protein